MVEVSSRAVGKEQEHRWLGGQVEAFRRARPRYERFARVLSEVLAGGAKPYAPLAIVETRAKSISSFAEKALRKQAKYADPVHQFTDLAGGRVICRTLGEVEAVSRWVERAFLIDEANSEDVRQRLKPVEFGYRSTHYIASFRPDAAYAVEVPSSVRGLWGEVQVRTLAEHAWADFGHDISYKGAFELPARWQRQLAVIAAQLEDVDQAFSRFEDAIRLYGSRYGSYLPADRIPPEIDALGMVLAADPDNPELAWRIAKLAMQLEDWRMADEVLGEQVRRHGAGSVPEAVLRDLGVARCKLHRGHPRSRGFLEGQRYLRAAVEAVPTDTDALTSYAGTWRGVDEERAAELYRRAFDSDPTDYYPLGQFLEYEIRRTGSASIVAAMRPVLEAAMARCEGQAEVRINLPWAYFGIGMLALLLGEPDRSLRAYAKGVQASTAGFMIDGALAWLDAVAAVRDELPGHDPATRMLALGAAVRFPGAGATARLRELASAEPWMGEPVVMVVGGTHPAVEAQMQRFRAVVAEGFRGFSGTVVSGGTEQGVSGLVGEVAERSGGAVHAIAYHPRPTPPAPDATVDPRYAEIRKTTGEAFSPVEPLQAWVDLVASGVDPRGVKVLGINGGDIAAIEYRIALALGAPVGVLQGSGRAAAGLLADADWLDSATLVPLPEDPQTVRMFVAPAPPQLPAPIRDTVAREIHERHRAVTQTAPLKAWPELEEMFRDSSRLQADHMLSKLREVGCRAVEVTDRPIRPFELGFRDVERLAEIEHGRWTTERLTDGWRWGPDRDDARRIHPNLVPWADLPESVRELDRRAVRDIPELLRLARMEVRRNGDG
jgi:ppGpp synthetase/RelA/SpoT-type nucleotidyltranferase